MEIYSGEIKSALSCALKKCSFPASCSCPSTGNWQSSREKGQNKSVLQESGILSPAGSLFTLSFLFPQGQQRRLMMPWAPSSWATGFSFCPLLGLCHNEK